MLETLGDGGLLIGGGFDFMSLAAVGWRWRGSARAGRPARRPPRRDADRASATCYTGAVQRVYGGDFTGSPTAIDVRWLRCAALVRGRPAGTGWCYALSDADKGYRLRAGARGVQRRGRFRAGAELAGRGRAGLAPVRDLSGAIPTRTASSASGYTLTVQPGLWEPTPTSYPLRVAPLHLRGAAR